MAILAVSAVIVLALGHWVISFVLMGIAMAVNWQMEAFPFSFNIKSDRDANKSNIKILTCNLNRAYTTSVNNGTEQEVADFIRKQEADVVLLQEFNPLIYKQIDDILRNSYPYGIDDDEGNRFKSVYSRYVIKEYKQLTTEKEVLPVCSMEVCVNGVNILVFNCHLKSNEFSTVYRAVKNSHKNLLSGVPKSISSIMRGYKTRQYQTRMILNEIVNSEQPVFLCGDLNDVCGSRVLRSFKKAGFKAAWWQLGNGLGFTYWGMNMRFRLDHILYRGKSISPNSIKVLNSNFSDHRPMVATFCVKKCF